MSCTVCRSLSMLTNSWTVICSSGHQGYIWSHNFRFSMSLSLSPNSLYRQTTDCTEGGGLTREHCKLQQNIWMSSNLTTLKYTKNGTFCILLIWVSSLSIFSNFIFFQNFNVVATCGFSIWYKIILQVLFTRFKYLQIMRKLFLNSLSFLLLLLDWVPFCPTKGK
jgi:hypothetical protein